MSVLLDGVRVLEVAGELGATCARFLESLGAVVERIAHGEVAARLADADVLIGDRAADFRKGAKFDPEALRAGNPGLVSVSLTPFGVSGPYADFAGPEIVVSAMGGCLGVVGYEDRPPVKEALDACGFHAEVMATAGALFALTERQASGLGQHVDVSVQDVAASRMTNGILAWQFDHRLLERTGVALSYGKARVRCVWDLKDGYVFHSLMTGRFGAPANAALSAWMDEAGFDNPMRGIDWLKYDRSALDEATRDVWQAAMDHFFRSITRAEMRIEGRRRGINACVVNDPCDVLEDVQLAAREFWKDEGGVKSARTVRSSCGERQAGCAAGARDDRSGAIGRRARARFFVGAGGVDHHEAAGGFRRRGGEGRKFVRGHASRRIDVQVAASKRGNFDDKPWFIHMNTSKQSPAAQRQAPGGARSARSAGRMGGCGGREFLAGDDEVARARLCDAVGAAARSCDGVGQRVRTDRAAGAGMGCRWHRRGAVGRIFLTGWPDRTPVTPSSVPYGDLILPPDHGGCGRGRGAACAEDGARRACRCEHV